MAIVEATHQRSRARPHIAEGLGELGFAGELAQSGVGRSGQSLGDWLWLSNRLGT
jgi:hypothetical protein